MCACDGFFYVRRFAALSDARRAPVRACAERAFRAGAHRAARGASKGRAGAACALVRTGKRLGTREGMDACSKCRGCAWVSRLIRAHRTSGATARIGPRSFLPRSVCAFPSISACRHAAAEPRGCARETLGRDRDERVTRSFIANAIVEPGSLRTQPRDVSPGRYARGRPQSFRYANFPAWAGEAQCALPRPHA